MSGQEWAWPGGLHGVLSGRRESAPFDPSLGVAFATEITISFRGDEPTSGVMDGTYTTEVSSVSTAPIYSMLVIPAAYTLTTR